jgi:hypothetical protein
LPQHIHGRARRRHEYVDYVTELLLDRPLLCMGRNRKPRSQCDGGECRYAAVNAEKGSHGASLNVKAH